MEPDTPNQDTQPKRGIPTRRISRKDFFRIAALLGGAMAASGVAGAAFNEYIGRGDREGETDQEYWEYKQVVKDEFQTEKKKRVTGREVLAEETVKRWMVLTEFKRGTLDPEQLESIRDRYPDYGIRGVACESGEIYGYIAGAIEFVRLKKIGEEIGFERVIDGIGNGLGLTATLDPMRPYLLVFECEETVDVNALPSGDGPEAHSRPGATRSKTLDRVGKVLIPYFDNKDDSAGIAMVVVDSSLFDFELLLGSGNKQVPGGLEILESKSA